MVESWADQADHSIIYIWLVVLTIFSGLHGDVYGDVYGKSMLNIPLTWQFASY